MLTMRKTLEVMRWGWNCISLDPWSTAWSRVISTLPCCQNLAIWELEVHFLCIKSMRFRSLLATAPSITLTIAVLQEVFFPIKKGPTLPNSNQENPILKCKVKNLVTSFPLDFAGKAAGRGRAEIWDIVNKWTCFYFLIFIRVKKLFLQITLFLIWKNLTLMK